MTKQTKHKSFRFTAALAAAVFMVSAFSLFFAPAAQAKCAFNSVGDWICQGGGNPPPQALPRKKEPPKPAAAYNRPYNTAPTVQSSYQAILRKAQEDAKKAAEKALAMYSNPVPGGPPVELCMPMNGPQLQANPGNLQSVINGAACGSTIHIGPGNYSAFTYSKKCSADNPIVITAGSQSGAKFSGNIKISGDGLIFHGAETSSAKITINGDYNRITGMQFTGSSSIEYIEGSSYNRFDHNDVLVAVQGGGQNAFMSFYRPRSKEQMYLSNRIDSNYWSTGGSSSGRPEGYAIFLGMYGAQDGYQYAKQFGAAGTIIENNLWENWNRKNVIEMKLSQNVIQNNTITGSGRILFRHGIGSTAQNNIFENSAGLEIREADHKIINNYFTGGSKLMLDMGTRKYPDGACWQQRDWVPKSYDPRQLVPQGPPAINVTLTNNRGPLLIGHKQGAGCEMPVVNTNITCHEGDMSSSNAVGTQGKASGIGSCNFQMPHKITRSEVGRSAPDDNC